MKKASKPGSVSKPAPKPLAAKPNKGISIPLRTPQKATAKSLPKPNPKVQGQAELAKVVAQLALNAENLAQAADRLAEAALRNSQEGERRDEILKTPEPPEDETAKEGATDLAAPQQRKVLDAPDLTAPEVANATDFKTLGEYPGVPDPPKDE